MNQVALETDVHRRITEFVRGRFLDGDPQEELRDDTPLLELGVINSMNVAQLLALIQNDLGVQVPLSVITQTTLQSITSITDLVVAERNRQEPRPPTP